MYRCVGGQARATHCSLAAHRQSLTPRPPPARVPSCARCARVSTLCVSVTLLTFTVHAHHSSILQLTSWQAGWVVSIFFFGGVLGGAFSSWANDSLGRRVPLLLAGLMTTVAAMLGTTTTSFWWLLCVRCLYGIAMGVNNASLAIYYAEVTPKTERGGVVAMTEVFFAMGGICACLTQMVLQAVLVTPPQARNAWRVLMGLEAVPGLVMFLGALRCCESPHWLLRRGDSAQAERVMHLIYRPRRLPGGGCDCAERNADLADAMGALLQSQTQERDGNSYGRRRRGMFEALGHTAVELMDTLALLRSPVKRIRRALELNLWMASMPLIGIGCIPQQFVPMLLEQGQVARATSSLGHHVLPSKPPLRIARSTLLIDLVCNVVYVAGSLVTCLFLVDRFGRRALLCVCLFASSVGFALDAVTQAGMAPGATPGGAGGDWSLATAVIPPRHPHRHVDLVLMGVVLGYIARAMGVGPLHQVVGSEVVPQDIAARGKALYAMARRGSAMLFCLLFPPLLASVGGELIFASLAAATLIYFFVVWLRLPETKGYDAREVETLLDGNSWIPFASVPPPASPTAGQHSDLNFSSDTGPAQNMPRGRLARGQSFVMAVPDLGA